jgi:hypothetical protein
MFDFRAVPNTGFGESGLLLESDGFEKFKDGGYGLELDEMRGNGGIGVL